MSFQPLQPRNLGNYTDLPVKAEKKALDAVAAYIDSLQKQSTMLESLRDSLALVILELIRELRARETEDFLLLNRLTEIENMVNSL